MKCKLLNENIALKTSHRRSSPIKLVIPLVTSSFHQTTYISYKHIQIYALNEKAFINACNCVYVNIHIHYYIFVDSLFIYIHIYIYVECMYIYIYIYIYYAYIYIYIQQREMYLKLAIFPLLRIFYGICNKICCSRKITNFLKYISYDDIILPKGSRSSRKCFTYKNTC